MSEAKLQILEDTPKKVLLKIEGLLNAQSTASIWRKCMPVVDDKQPHILEVDASELTYCDGAGIGLFVELNRRQLNTKGQYVIKGLKEEFQRLLKIYCPDKPESLGSKTPSREKISFMEILGKRFFSFLGDVFSQLSFTGKTAYVLVTALKKPSRHIRWRDVWRVVELAGVDAVSIVFLLNLIMGVVIAFQAAIPLQMMGADIYIADLIAISITRVLGPLMTAIILAGRTGSAFAAELGTMKINEEIDALNTMGIEPVRFLVINRIIGLIILFPVLTLIADIAGITGGGIIFKSLGYPIVTYVDRIIGILNLKHFLGGFVKSFAYGIAIGAIGCLRGMQTKTGASAVGQSATSAVVSGFVLIMLIEGTFSVVYYFLGI